MADPVTLRELADRAFLDSLDQLAARLSPEIGKAVREAIAALLAQNRSGSVVPTRDVQRAVIEAVQRNVGTVASTYVFGDRVIDPGWQGFVGPLIRMVQGPDSPLILHTASYLKAMDRVLGTPALRAQLGTSAAAADWYRETATEIARKTSASLVRAVTDAMRKNIREAEARAWAESLEQPELRALIAKTGIGLTPHQRKIVDNLAKARGIKPTSKAYGALVRAAVNKRVKLIASHEAAQTALRTQREHWRTLVARGIKIDGLGGSWYYVSDLGEISAGPLAHCRCQCAERTVSKEDSGGYNLEWVARRVNNKPCPRCEAFDGKIKQQLGPDVDAEPAPTG